MYRVDVRFVGEKNGTKCGRVCAIALNDVGAKGATALCGPPCKLKPDRAFCGQRVHRLAALCDLYPADAFERSANAAYILHTGAPVIAILRQRAGCFGWTDRFSMTTLSAKIQYYGCDTIVMC